MFKYNFIFEWREQILKYSLYLNNDMMSGILRGRLFRVWASFPPAAFRELAKPISTVMESQDNNDMWSWYIGDFYVESYPDVTKFDSHEIPVELMGWVWSDWDTPTKEIYWMLKDGEEYASHMFCFEFNTKQLEPRLQALEQQIAQRGQALEREKLEKQYLLRLKAINHMPTFSEQTTDAQLAFEQPKMEVVPALENLLAELRQTPMDAELRTRLLGLVQTKLDAFVQGWDLRNNKPVPFSNEESQYQAIAGDFEPRLAACQTLEDVYALIGYLYQIPMFQALQMELRAKITRVEQAINRRIREEKG